MQLLSPASLAIWQFEEIEKCMPRDKALRQEIDAIVAQMLAEPVSKMAFRKLERDGVNSSMLGRFLVFIASLPKLRRRKEWRGMAWYTFERFPARLRALANQIDDINAHPALTPKRWAAVVSSKKKAIRARQAREFQSLPETMREYADYLHMQLHLIQPALRREEQALSLQRGILVMLLDVVRGITGKPHYTDLALLLEYAYEFAAHQAKEISPASLKMLSKRHPFH
jgi:hypothetical protein